MDNSNRKFLGWYIAKVTEVDPTSYKDYGAVRVSIPDFMHEDFGIDLNNDGIIAYPANNPLGGRIEDNLTKGHYFQGTVYIPPKGSSVWVFFLDGDLDKCFYTNAVNFQYSKLPPEQTSANEPHKVYTVIKTNSGRTVCVSDDENTQRVEITGKKRNLSGNDPSGNLTSTYTIDENMTTILLDEREGAEKLLIRTVNGDYVNIDITNRKLMIEFENDIIIKTNGNFSLDVQKDFIMKCQKDAKITSGKDMNIKSNASTCITSKDKLSLKSTGSNVAIDGVSTYTQSGQSRAAAEASPLTPSGDRDL